MLNITSQLAAGNRCRFSKTVAPNVQLQNYAAACIHATALLQPSLRLMCQRSKRKITAPNITLQEPFCT
jgi:hypothetical protein